MRHEPHEGSAFDQRFGDGDGNCKAVSRAGPAAQLVDDRHALTVDVAHDESCFTHFGRESRDVCFDVVVEGDAREELADDWERSVLSWHEASDLRHHLHQGDGADVCAFAAHVAARDDLEALLLGCVDVVGDVFRFLDFLADGVAAGFDGEGVGELRADVVLGCDEVGERG